ncbi:MAG TPA: dienelactone hydrolase family protein [Candidatus Thermoplasmatota archaeon]|nr:dienelactone hydrolase family protein [Candidatus Thermoplasmatota archaeon]
MIPRTSLVLVAFVLALAGCTERTQAPPAEGGGSAADRTQDPADGMDHDVPPQAGEDEPSNEDALAPGPHEVESDEVAIGNGSAYYARPVGAGPWPGVVMIHEWWGLNDHIRDMARLLSSEGYAVVAVDLLGDVATTSAEAQALTRAYNATDGVKTMRAAAAYLRDDAHALSVASLGWCFGGGQSLQLALSGEPLFATVLYYGAPVTDPARLAQIDGPVLGIFGVEDRSIPLDKVEAFDRNLTAAGVVHEIHVYPGVGHAFANPSGASWAPEETADAWAKTKAFLAEAAR